MRLDAPLDDIFRTRSHVRLLRSLDELPEGFPASAREVARRAGVSHPTASNVLASLAAQGLVFARRTPRQDAFELNREHILAEKIAGVFQLERQLRDELVSFLRREIRQDAHPVSEAFLFGSVVRTETAPTSDIDVAVLCSADAADAVIDGMDRVAEAVRRRFGNPLSVIVATKSPRELKDRRRPGHQLWRPILQEGIRLLPLSEEDSAHA